MQHHIIDTRFLCHVFCLNKYILYINKVKLWGNSWGTFCVHFLSDEENWSLKKKFVSFRRDPYKVLKTVPDLTYEIDCGQNGTPQIIHVIVFASDIYTQRLLDEALPDDDDESKESQGEDDVLGPSEMRDCSEIESEHEVKVSAHVRQRSASKWLNDYVQYQGNQYI